MKRAILIVSLLFGVLLIGACVPELPAVAENGNDIVEAGATIKIAAFNIQIFGPATCDDANVMDILARIAREFDVLFVQEIRNKQEDISTCYLAEINGLDGPVYKFVESTNLGANQEAYAYFYNTEAVELIPDSEYVWDDADDVFDREPYIASFRSGNFDFTLVGIHVKPEKGTTAAEIGALAQVYASILAGNPGERDVIILGDFNADGSYFDEDGASALKTSKFTWAITNDMDTMVKTDWTYDRIVMTDATAEHEFDSAAVFYFDSVFGIVDQELIEDVSDHFPVYAIFLTNLVDDDTPF